MITDGSARDSAGTRRGWHSTRRLSLAVAARLLLFGACCVIAWCGLAALSGTTASAAEPGDTTQSSGGLLDSGLLGHATGSLTSLTGSVATGDASAIDAPAPSDGTDGKNAAEPARDGAAQDGDLLGSVTDSAMGSTQQTLTPVRALVDPAGDLATNLDHRAMAAQPMLLTAHQAGQGLLGGVATELGPLASAVPVSASVPTALDSVTSNLTATSGGGRTLAASAPTAFQAADQAVDASTVANRGAEPVAGTSGTAGTATSTDAHGELPAQPLGDRGQPAGGHSMPSNNSTSSSTQLGNGSGSAGSHAFAELVRMLAASRPSVAVPTTDTDIASHDDGRPSVSPD